MDPAGQQNGVFLAVIEGDLEDVLGLERDLVWPLCDLAQTQRVQLVESALEHRSLQGDNDVILSQFV